jgi:hypothetical protein
MASQGTLPLSYQPKGYIIQQHDIKAARCYILYAQSAVGSYTAADFLAWLLYAMCEMSVGEKKGIYPLPDISYERNKILKNCYSPLNYIISNYLITMVTLVWCQ